MRHCPTGVELCSTPAGGGSEGSAIAAGFVAHAVAHTVLHAAQTPVEALGKLMARTPKPRLQGVLSYTKFLGRFSCGVAFHFAQEERGAKKWREVIQVFVDHLADFRACIDLLGIGPVIGKALGDGQFVLVLRIVERNGGASLGAAALHQSGVDDDARQPGGELRAALEALKVAIRGKQTVLQSVFGVLGIAQDAKSGLEQLALVAPKKSLNRLSIATLSGPDQLLFAELLFAKLRNTHHLRCHLLPPCSLLRVVQHKKVTDTSQPQCTGIPPCTLGFFIISKIGMTAKKMMPSILKLSRKASMVACRCTML